MRITRLKLNNFIGIKNGIGVDEIEIIFPNNGKVFTQLDGDNGSGKSTIMSMLTPFKDSFDDRKSLILSGKEGTKEIDYEHNGHTYKIKHIYGSKSMSFISEDDVELNENGGVRTFEEIVKQKLEVDKEYMKIGRIGSNTETFIQFTTTQRKVYITSFISEVKKFLDAFEIVSKKAKENNKQIDQITNDLKKLGDADTVTKKIAELEESLSTMDETSSNLSKALGKLDSDIISLSDTMSSIDYNQAKANIKLIETQIKKCANASEKLNGVSLEDCISTIDSLNKEIAELEKIIAADEAELRGIKANLINCDNNIVKYQAQLKGATHVDLTKLKEEIDALYEEKKEIEKYLNENKLSKLMYASSSKNLIYLDSFSAFIKIILANYTVLNQCDINQGVKNIELFFSQNFSDTFVNYRTLINSNISANRDLLETVNAELAKLHSNENKLEILAKRPVECSLDMCPFIADALKYSNLNEEIEKTEAKAKSIKASIASDEETVEHLSDLKVLYSNIAKAYSAMYPRENLIYAYYIKETCGIKQLTSLPLNDLQIKYDTVKELAESIIAKINRIYEINCAYETKHNQYLVYSKTEETHSYFKSELDKEQELKQDYEKSEKELTDRININKSSLTSKSEDLSVYTDYKNSLTEMSSLEANKKSLLKDISVYEDSSKSYNSKVAEKSTLERTLAQLNIDKKNSTTTLTELKASEITINQLTDNKNKLTETFDKVSSVKDALSPKAGIPLIFIQSYLDGTEAIANELLYIAYGGKFEIKFVPTESDFFIQVRSGDNVIQDIKLASQGEISLTTISISLALIERALGSYNILCLDEIDGPLSKGNRDSFINILKKQIEKLHLEQVFLISHNRSFESCDMNLILLPGNTVDKTDAVYMENKEIIYDATE